MVMVMVIFSAPVRSHQSTSLVASASCVPRVMVMVMVLNSAYTGPLAARGSPDLPAQGKGVG